MPGISHRWAEFLGRQTQDYYVKARDDRSHLPDAFTWLDSPSFFNNFSGNVPGYGVGKVTGVHDMGTSGSAIYVPQLDRPGTITAGMEFLVNTGTDVPESAVGTYQNEGECMKVLFDSSGTPGFGQQWVPKSGQFSISLPDSNTPAGCWCVNVFGVVDSDNSILLGKAGCYSPTS